MRITLLFLICLIQSPWFPSTAHAQSSVHQVEYLAMDTTWRIFDVIIVCVLLSFACCVMPLLYYQHLCTCGINKSPQNMCGMAMNLLLWSPQTLNFFLISVFNMNRILHENHVLNTRQELWLFWPFVHADRNTNHATVGISWYSYTCSLMQFAVWSEWPRILSW